MNLADLSVTEFLNELSSVSPAPGGGSVAALCGGLGSALCSMVGRLTYGKEKYRAEWESMETLINEADSMGKRFIKLMDADTDAYNKVVEAIRLPRETDEEKAVRKAAIEKATRHAAEVPMETLRNALVLSDHVALVVEKGNTNCISDAATAAQLVRTAAYSAACNVRINLGGISDKVFVKNLQKEVRTILSAINSSIDRIEKKVDSMIV